MHGTLALQAWLVSHWHMVRRMWGRWWLLPTVWPVCQDHKLVWRSVKMNFWLSDSELEPLSREHLPFDSCSPGIATALEEGKVALTHLAVKMPAINRQFTCMWFIWPSITNAIKLVRSFCEQWLFQRWSQLQRALWNRSDLVAEKWSVGSWNHQGNWLHLRGTNSL